MHIDDVRGTQQTGIVEVAALEEEQVERSLASVIRIAIAARDIELQAEARLPRCILPRVSGVDTAGPRKDAILAKVAELQDAFVRLLKLLAAPADRAALAPLVKQEILYRLLSGPSGAMLYHTLLGERREQGVSAAILWIKQHYDQPMKIEELARAVSMSPSVLHRRFKAVTVMSPLQYQKRMRLTEARKLLLAGSMEAATAAYRVGYESPSQFSREYRRLFGASPLQDAEFLRHRDIE